MSSASSSDLSQCVLLVLLGIVACTTSPGDTVDELATPVFSISGLVSIPDDLDSLHRLVAGTEVRLTGTRYRAFTNDSGFWRLDSIPAGGYDLVVARDGYDTAFYFALQVHPPLGAPLVVTDLQRAEDVRFTLTNFRQVGGRLLSLRSFHAGDTGRVKYLYLGTSAQLYPAESGYFYVRYISHYDSSDVDLNCDGLTQYGVKKGDSLYAAVFSYSNYISQATDGKRRYLNVRLRSNVVGAIVP